SPSLPGGLFLFRGQSDIQLVKGEIFERKEFTSTSLNPHEAEKFNRGALLYIRIPPRGYPGILTGKWEEEVLLPAGTRFLIVDRKSNSEGLLRILVEPCMETCRQPDTVLKEIGSGWTSLE
ncbi:MAG: ADP-ribosyltransferase, partial [Pseudobdellovibrionaceae bacterium]